MSVYSRCFKWEWVCWGWYIRAAWMEEEVYRGVSVTPVNTGLLTAKYFWMPETCCSWRSVLLHVAVVNCYTHTTTSCLNNGPFAAVPNTNWASLLFASIQSAATISCNHLSISMYICSELNTVVELLLMKIVGSLSLVGMCSIYLTLQHATLWLSKHWVDSDCFRITAHVWRCLNGVNGV